MRAHSSKKKGAGWVRDTWERFAAPAVNPLNWELAILFKFVCVLKLFFKGVTVAAFAEHEAEPLLECYQNDTTPPLYSRS